ncbi:MAG: T9SS type A sorting domain-containing protein [Bacteroidota bacterium]|nr:T9SS type A sorting domain-containing protein [Bacteroidota bacterium]
MRVTVRLIVFLLLVSPAAYSQLRDFRVHTRSMLHETEFNTGEIGRAFDRGDAGVADGMPSMEWPPNSKMILDRLTYAGQHNSMGGGLWVAATEKGVRQYSFCGAVTDNNGHTTAVENVYSFPVSIQRTENYPVLSDGNLNSAYNPDDAEEIITATWGTTSGITVTRTSRAWSWPGYNDFIIYEYDLQNITPDTLYDVFISFTYGFAPSMFGYERRYNRWAEGDYRQADQFARFDLKRWMTYNQDRSGKPDTNYFDLWSTSGNRGGLDSPQAAGLLMLHFDYDHLATQGQTSIIVSRTDSQVVWDQNHKIKQPYLHRYENANLYTTKGTAWLDPEQDRKTGPFKGTSDSTGFGAFTSASGQPYYWIGRGKPSWSLSWSQPVVHAYGFAPYTLPPGQSLKFSVAEVVGYGPGDAGDTVYQDLGGGIRNEPAPGLHPIPSWYQAITYPNVGNPSVIGSNYLQTHPLPWYVTPGVVSIRDVADRAIQLYTGRPLIKYDSLQLEPDNTPAAGNYSTVSIPFPAPAITIENTRAAVNRIMWGTQVENMSSVPWASHLHAPLKDYEVWRADDPLGPWTLIDSVSVHDPRYFNDSAYVVYDTASNLGSFSYYAVLSVDSLGGKSGWTNFTAHETQAPAVAKLGKVYVAPNPLIVTNGLGGSDPNGEVTDRLQFFGLTKDCTIRIFSYSGQLVQTIHHHQDAYGNPWYQISRNNQLLASGVYFFVVEDAGGATTHGKFVIIH